MPFVVYSVFANVLEHENVAIVVRLYYKFAEGINVKKRICRQREKKIRIDAYVFVRK